MKKRLMFLQLFIAVLAIGVIYTACTKEYSYESGSGGTPAGGTLAKDSATGDCLTPEVIGNYYTGVLLSQANYVAIQVNVSKAGNYLITTNTANGFSFSDSSFFSGTGLQTVRLKAKGTPTNIGATAFTVMFDTSVCTFTVNVQDGSNVINDLTKSDSAWQFQANGVFYHGPMDTAFLFTDTSGIKGLAMAGGKLPTKDTILSLNLRLPTNGTISPGMYITNNTVATERGGAFYLVLAPTPLSFTNILSADDSTAQVVNILVSSYDQSTKIIQGTFSGTARTATNTSVPITNGKFIARVAQ